MTIRASFGPWTGWRSQLALSDGTKRSRHTGRALATIAGSLLVVSAVLVSTAPPAEAGWTCRVRNVTQGTAGRSLASAVEDARGGDRLRVWGTCRGPIVISADIVIKGKGPDPTIVGQWDRWKRALSVRRGARAALLDLTIERGRTATRGGGIWNRGRLTLVGVIVQDNRSEHFLVGTGGAGGIYNGGRLIAVDSIIRGNVAEYAGGGIMTRGPGAWTTLRRSVVADNASPNVQDGGGLANDSRTTIIDSVVRDNRDGGVRNSGTLELVRSTVRHNKSYIGGGILNWGAVIATESAIVGNVATGEGGGGIFSNGTVRLVDSRVRANTARGSDGGGIWNLGRAELIGSTVTANVAGFEGGGIWNSQGSPDDGVPPGIVTLDAGSSVTGNVPDDCVGTDAC